MHGPCLYPGGEAAADRHVAVEYASDDEWARHLVPFVRDGLVGGEQVQYYADATDPDVVTRTLADRGVDVDSALRRGQLVVATAEETYLSGAGFDPDVTIRFWREAVSEAAARGFTGVRTVGEMSWTARDVAGAERMLEYELRMHYEVVERLPARSWCFYDRRLLSQEDLEVLAAAHLTRSSADAAPGGRPGLSVTPLSGPPGFRLAGSAGYESRHVIASTAAALAASPARRPTLDLSLLDHLDIAALADLADAARRRSCGTPVRMLGAPPALHRLLELFPELGEGLEVADR
ncbi:MEDS domain-containing protein [Streptomyces pactum]|uniref:MEDS domain-containing protein n=1 Tax=Streptomyces pactum TaxID=68249 RepID=A0ABS0NFF9_9ACTN|nr:MEDS domain-containing protein [Streptomyces pactum]MBH5333924.1 MEDS domain-containing protein [Streptomyces pactum]